MESLEKALYRHETGRAQVRDDVYRKLYCLAYEASPHELFGDLDYEDSGSGETAHAIRSHKFVTAFAGATNAARVIDSVSADPAPGQWMTCHRAKYSSPFGEGYVYTWPFGAVIFHLAEDLELPSLAHFAIWRTSTYRENLAWVTDELSRMLPEDRPPASYVLSAYWVHRPAWSSDALDTALRILCIPKTLLDRDTAGPDALGHAALVEQSLIAQGFSHPSLHAFGVKGIATGYASWCGVVYHPLAEKRCLAEDELVSVELATQALWTYCTHINSEVESGRDPRVPSEYGWRFLRGVRSLLVNPRPQESEQHRAMRNAVIKTSGLDVLLTQAIDILRETEGRP
ncbi:MAG: hypothetical protein QOE51_400 [Actinoplanes sp.]|nr:hypothetical protein [Actinoplanes sp.]